MVVPTLPYPYSLPSHRAVVLSRPFCFEPGTRYSVTLRLWRTKGVRRPEAGIILLDSVRSWGPHPHLGETQVLQTMRDRRHGGLGLCLTETGGEWRRGPAEQANANLDIAGPCRQEREGLNLSPGRVGAMEGTQQRRAGEKGRWGEAAAMILSERRCCSD